MPDFKLDIVKVKAAIDIAMSLIVAGTNMYQALKNKDGLTVDDLNQMIDEVNEKQEQAKADLRALIELKKSEEGAE